MRVHYCDHVEFPLPADHRFPIRKYRLLRAELESSEWMTGVDFVPSPLISRRDLELVHASDWVRRFFRGELSPDEVRRVGFPWSREYVARSRASVGGTLAAARAALEEGVSGQLAGGTHHAHAEFGSGYCTFNDIAVAAARLLHDRIVNRVLVFDLDVHQGDGTASIFQGDSRVFTCSVHGARNFPRVKMSSDLDISLEDDVGDDAYLDAVRSAFERCLEAGRPDLVFFQAGVDPLQADRLGRLALSHEGLERRDRFVFEQTRKLGLPVVITLGGGYASPIEESVRAHRRTFELARETYDTTR